MEFFKIKPNREENGITLVALILSIIVMTILAGVSISALIQLNMVDTSAEGAEKYATEQIKELQVLDNIDNRLEEETKILQEISNTPIVEPDNPSEWTANTQGKIEKTDIISPTVTIPNCINGTRVDTVGSGEFGESIFSNASSVTSIEISVGITSISDFAFIGCTNLETITIPNSVRTIGREAFYNCKKLKNVIISDDSRLTKIGGAAFEGCSALTTITIPKKVVEVGDAAFGYCTSLTNITIPNSVTAMGNQVFTNCRNLTVNIKGASEVPTTWNSGWNSGADIKEIKYI